jgi:thioredoxin reductase
LASVAGKAPPIAEQTDVLVIGAGTSGVAAALTAARAGARVMLIDENPVDFKSMAEEIPLHFGGRMSASLQNRNSALERVLESNPALTEAFEAGIEVRLGTACFGLFPKHASAAWMEVPAAGLVDADHAYLVGYHQAIVAAGRRDMGLAFEGWQLPGVMGANAAHRLSVQYDALDAKRAVLVGSDNQALEIANLLAARNVRIEAIVEQAGAVQGSSAMLERLEARGARFYPGHVLAKAQGDLQGVTRLVLVKVDAHGRHMPGETVELACDTVLLGVGSIPAIELLEAAGCCVHYDAARGGHVPRLDGFQRTSVEGVHAIGDCAGIWDSKTCGDEIPAREGRIAANAALRALGMDVASRDEAVVAPDPTRDCAASRLAWVRASVLNSAAAPLVCQCEEVNAADILNLRPPRYVPLPDSRPNVAPSNSQHAAGCASPDLVKRLTRAGMGSCQGRRCREQVGALLALGSGRELCKVPHATYRAPVRPLPLSQLAALPESPDMDEHWDSWFGMPSQWIPFWRVPPTYTVADRGEDEAARE